MARKELALVVPEEWAPEMETAQEWWDQWYNLPVTQAVIARLKRRYLDEIKKPPSIDPNETQAARMLAEGLRQALVEIEMTEQRSKPQPKRNG